MTFAMAQGIYCHLLLRTWFARTSVCACFAFLSPARRRWSEGEKALASRELGWQQKASIEPKQLIKSAQSSRSYCYQFYEIVKGENKVFSAPFGFTFSPFSEIEKAHQLHHQQHLTLSLFAYASALVSTANTQTRFESIVCWRREHCWANKCTFVTVEQERAKKKRGKTIFRREILIQFLNISVTERTSCYASLRLAGCLQHQRPSA